MENFIKVVDNFIPKSLENKLDNILSYHLHYQYVPNTVEKNDEDYCPSFSRKIYHQLELENTDKDYLFTLSPLYVFLNSQNLFLHNILQARIFFQIPSIAPPIHKPHVDLNVPHQVCLYYVNDSDGDTIIYDSTGKTIRKISPKKGRMIFFNGNLKHSASTPTQNHRAVINYNVITEKI